MIRRIRRRRRWLRPAAAALGLALLAGHVGCWYLPREHPAAPDPDDLPGRLLAAGGPGVALWVPYPHQNLALLRRGLGGEREAEEWLAAARRLAGLPGRPLPAFGPFPLPPAREMTVAAGPGERLTVAARVFPALAAVGRLAGRLAGNPWLAGGEAPAFGGTAQVSWRGTLWSVTSGGEMAVPDRGPPEVGEALAVLRLDRPATLLPAGTWRLHRPPERPGALELAPAAEGPGAATDAGVWRRGAGLPGQGVALALANGPGGPLAETPGVLLLFARREDDSPGLPAAAALFPPGTAEDRRLRLPREYLPALLRGDPRRSEAAGWEIAASDAEALAAAEELAPRVSGLLAPPLAAGLWLSPRPLEELVADIAGTLEEIPLVRRRDVRRWRDAATLLGPFEHVEEITLLLAGDRQAPRLRLETRER